MVVGKWEQFEGKEIDIFVFAAFPKIIHASSSVSLSTLQDIRDNTNSKGKIPFTASLLPVVCA